MAESLANPLISVEGRTIVPRSVTARFDIRTEEWLRRNPARLARLLGFAKWGDWLYGPEHSRACLEVAIEVDDESGADCALFPHLVMVFEPGGWKGAGFDALEGQDFTEGDGRVTFEGYFGNDAPHFDENTVQFQAGPNAGTLMLDWTAKYRWLRTDPVETFHFRGPIRIQGLSIQLKRDEDLVPVLAASMPGFDVASLNPPNVTDVNHGRRTAKHRRNWRHHWFACKVDG